MIRVVLDTNVIVSAYLNEDGLPFIILRLALGGAVKLYASEVILEEYKELLHRKSFPLDRRRAHLLLKEIRAASTIVKPASGLDEALDPDDNMFLECARAARADYVITGNTGHFPRVWKYSEIVTPRMFINIWKGGS